MGGVGEGRGGRKIIINPTQNIKSIHLYILTNYKKTRNKKKFQEDKKDEI